MRSFVALALVAAAACSARDATPARSPSSPPSSQTPAPLNVGGDVVAPVLLNSVAPRAMGIRGRVVFRAVISESGKVEALETVESDHPSLTKAAEDAVRQWQYRPATKDGHPVRVHLTVTVAFDVH